MKKFVKKQNVVDTAIALALGGGANVVMDIAIDKIDALAGIDKKWINAGKLAIGAIGSSLVSNKMAKDALNGVAVVGVSNLIQSLIDKASEDTPETVTGVPYGTVGRLTRRQLPNRRFAAAVRNRQVNGVPASTFVE